MSALIPPPLRKRSSIAPVAEPVKVDPRHIIRSSSISAGPRKMAVYPGTNVATGMFAARDWTVPDAAYRPGVYTAPSIVESFVVDPPADAFAPRLIRNMMASAPHDCNPTHLRRIRRSPPKFNAIDHSLGIPIDRRSLLGAYQIVDGLPRCGASHESRLPANFAQQPRRPHWVCWPRPPGALGTQPHH